ncbi:oligosaccharide flippase family protein, partial [candidate division GN15 bacterium]|nr:oligosaccharide flippase family protein [candidate division GN15 bacterium]
MADGKPRKHGSISGVSASSENNQSTPPNENHGNNETFGIRDFPSALLARNTVFNLVGTVMPLGLAVIAIPLLVAHMGTERFGVLTLAWMVSGYFNLFDLGIGRATTKFVADYRAMGRRDDMTSLVTTSFLMLAGIGAVGGIVTAVATPWLVTDILNIPDILERESLHAFYLLAAAVPFTVLTAGSRGVLEAEQRFGIVNAVKVPFSAATFLLPLAVLPFSNSLVPIIGTLVASRVVVLAVYVWYCREHVSLRPGAVSFEKVQVRKLLGFGGWLTVSQLVPPLMGNMDRFIIGAFLTMSAVAYYATPFDTIAKLAVIPNAILGVLFPVFSVYAMDQLARLTRLHARAIAYIMLVITPAAIALIALGDVVLDVWL